jgi:sugar phosphate isomerase/epimerase
VTRRELLAAAAACAALPLWAKNHWDRTRLSAITDEIGKTSDEAVDFAHDFGLQYVEVRNVPGTNKEYLAARDVEIQADATHFTNETVKVSCVHCGVLKYDWDGTDAAAKARWERRLDDLRKAIRCAQKMGADKVRIVAGLRAADPAAMMQRTTDAVGEMALEAEKQKIALLLGNDAATNVASGAEMAAVMKGVPSKSLGIDWNPHAGQGGYGQLPKKRILNVRAMVRSITPGAEFEDWKTILTALDKDGYNGKLALETGATGPTRFTVAHDGMDQLQHIMREVS